jgi:hypothetical protein
MAWSLDLGGGMHASPMRPRGSRPSSKDLRKCLVARFGNFGQYEPVTKLGRLPAFRMHLPKCLGHFEVLTWRTFPENPLLTKTHPMTSLSCSIGIEQGYLSIHNAIHIEEKTEVVSDTSWTS